MIVVAGGTGVRFRADKLMTPVAGLPLIAHTITALRDHVDRLILVCRRDQIPALESLDLVSTIVPGGASRTASEMAGLAALDEPPRLIGIHDGARPMVSGTLVEALFEAAERVGGAIPVVDPQHLLVRRSDLSPMTGLVAQTPQVFDGARLLAAYSEAKRLEYEAHDTAQVAQRFGGIEIEAVAGDPANIKVTTPEDMAVVRAALETCRNGPR